MRRLAITLAIAGGTLASVAVGADESATIFDQLQRLDSTAINESQRASQVAEQVSALDEELNAQWSAVDVAMRAARPIRADVTHGLGRWLRAYKAAEHVSTGGPQAGADTRRLLAYASGRALSVRLRDVDVVRRADAEHASFAGLMARRSRWAVEFARTSAVANAATDARGVLIADARTGSADADLATTDEQFDQMLSGLGGALADVDFHRFKGTLARPMTQPPEYHFGANAPLMRPSGWTYRGAIGDDVHAVHGGEVVYVGAAQGWGLVVVVDHGGGYMSAYGHLSEAKVAKGAQVNRADVIAAVGDSGSLDGSRLYFELRRDGKPVDPAQWFLKR